MKANIISKASFCDLCSEKAAIQNGFLCSECSDLFLEKIRRVFCNEHGIDILYIFMNNLNFGLDQIDTDSKVGNTGVYENLGRGRAINWIVNQVKAADYETYLAAQRKLDEKKMLYKVTER